MTDFITHGDLPEKVKALLETLREEMSEESLDASHSLLESLCKSSQELKDVLDPLVHAIQHLVLSAPDRESAMAVMIYVTTELTDAAQGQEPVH